MCSKMTSNVSRSTIIYAFCFLATMYYSAKIFLNAKVLFSKKKMYTESYILIYFENINFDNKKSDRIPFFDRFLFSAFDFWG